VREYRPPGSVRGAPGNRRPYLDNAECCGMGEGAGKRFPEQLRVKAPPRFHETLPRGIGEAVRNGQAADFQLGEPVWVLTIDTPCGDPPV
jgi:hypothetical protein